MKTAFQSLFIFTAFLGLAFGAVYFWFMQSAVMGHGGMAPTLMAGDQFAYWKDRVPDLGDIAVCEHPKHQGEFVVGRVMATSGMRVGSAQGELTINGHIPQKSYKGSVAFSSDSGEPVLSTRWGYETIGAKRHLFFDREVSNQYVVGDSVVTKGKVYLVGDNRLAPKYDSRTFGPVDVDRCIGVAAIRIKPGGFLDRAIPYGRFQPLK